MGIKTDDRARMPPERLRDFERRLKSSVRMP
jgi:hypothetical protein